ncbi:hypothetical protein LLG90_27980, partial [Aromatoleum toluclasticum]|uniref:hypothetical protein n=1 Tax=Aromatoleum toluclasticum TaxID=92003 RepID=UPI001D190833
FGLGPTAARAQVSEQLVEAAGLVGQARLGEFEIVVGAVAVGGEVVRAAAAPLGDLLQPQRLARDQAAGLAGQQERAQRLRVRGSAGFEAAADL